jgi:hypothetical protein
MRRLWISLLVVAGLVGCSPSHPAIVVDFGNSTDEFLGKDVEIDGKLVGKLQRDGQRPRTTFPVDAGDHAVRMAVQKYDSQPEVVTVKPGEELVLFAEVKPAAVQGGRPGVVLHR